MKLNFKLDVFELVATSVEIEDPELRAKRMDTVRDIVIAAVVAATRLAAAVRGRKERQALEKAGKKVHRKKGHKKKK